MKKTLVFLGLFLLLFNIEVLSAKADENDDLQIYPINDKRKIYNVLKYYQKNNKEKSVIKLVKNENRLKLNIEKNYNIAYENTNNNKVYDDNVVSNNYEVYEETANFDSKYTDLANYALQFVGNPYVAGGTSLTEGADCSGFVMKLYEQYGVSLPRTAPDQSRVGYAVSLENAQPGDIVSYGYNGVVGHSAIYIGNEMIVHAATPRDGITTASVYMMPIITIRRIG